MLVAQMKFGRTPDCILEHTRLQFGLVAPPDCSLVDTSDCSLADTQDCPFKHFDPAVLFSIGHLPGGISCEPTWVSFFILTFIRNSLTRKVTQLWPFSSNELDSD